MEQGLWMLNLKRIKWLSLLRIFLILGCMAYLLGLTVYLLLRLIFGSRFWWLGLLNNFTPWVFLPLFLLVPLIALNRTRWLLVVTAVFVVLGVIFFGPFYRPKWHPIPSGRNT